LIGGDPFQRLHDLDRSVALFGEDETNDLQKRLVAGGAAAKQLDQLSKGGRSQSYEGESQLRVSFGVFS
jgi:hypothetical protein